MEKENIIYDNEIVATVIYAEEIEPGVHFYGKDKSTLQIGKQLRMKGEAIKPHKHLPVKVQREEILQEVLYIEKGKMKITFYTDEWEEIDSRVLNDGDMILLIKGGHGFEMLEETVMIEVKQGPYNPDSTRRFEGK
ncbi:MAG: hypothetical protein KAS66_04975 [Candidatus Omnitrophica bacterium]|nr:hypothetical protein [Candidatus Omnitrophota bacterium]